MSSHYRVCYSTLGVSLAIIEYYAELIDKSDRSFVLVAEWYTDEGHWKSQVDILHTAVEESNFDVIGFHIRELEKRIKQRQGHDVKVVQKNLKLPMGWSSHRGPDAMIKRIRKHDVMTMTRMEEEESG